MNSSNPLNLVAALMLLMLVPGLLIVGVSGSVSDTGPMRPFFMLLAAAALMMGIGGVQMIVKWRRASRHEAEHQKAIRSVVGAPPLPAPGLSAEPAPAARMEATPTASAVAEHAVASRAAGQGAIPAPPSVMEPPASPAPAPAADQRAAPVAAARTLPSGEPVLAHWTYAADEWGAYTRKEWKRRIVEAFVVGIGVLLLGLLIGRNEPEGVAVAGSAMFAVLIIVGRLMKASHARTSNQGAPGEAVITPTAILLNGRYHVLANETFRFEGLRYLDDTKPPVLEFTVGWSTRGGRTNEQINVPVPAGREAEARELVAAFQRGWAVEMEGPSPGGA